MTPASSPSTTSIKRQRRPNPRVALVIGSGSTKCAAALGAWKALDRAGIPIDMVVGSSGGSLYAATMALGFTPEQCIEYTTQLWNKETMLKQNWRGLLSVFFPRLFNFKETFSVFSDKAIMAGLYKVFGDKTFADTKMILRLMTTDFHTGEETPIGEGKIVDAVRASLAIPAIWTAHRVNGRLLIDGAVSSPMPVDVAIKEGAQVILAMGFQDAPPENVTSLTDYVFHANVIITNSLYKSNFAFHNAVHHSEIVPVFPEFDKPISLFDTSQFPFIIEQGEKAMEEQIPYVRRLLAKAKKQMR